MANETLFGAPGVSDPIVFHPGLVGIRRHVNFAVANTEAGETYALFGLPKAFVVTGAFVEETSACTAGTVTLKTSEDQTVLAATSVGGETLARGAEQLASAIVLNDGDVVSIVTSAAMKEGALNIVVYGYTPYGDSLGNVVTPAYRASGQSEDDAAANRAGSDPYYEFASPFNRIAD